MTFKLTIICVLLLSIVRLQAQITRQATFRITLPETNLNKLFEQHPEIDSLNLDFWDGEPSFLRINKHKQTTIGGNTPGEVFDLQFEGDRFLFRKGYGDISFPKPPPLTLDYLTGISKEALSNTCYDVEAIFHRDSMIYKFTLNHYHGIFLRRDRKQNSAKFKGDILALKTALEDSYKEFDSAGSIDSILVFEGIVGRDGRLESIKLISGERSIFSDQMLVGLQKYAIPWWPANQGGRTVREPVKIYVKLHLNGEITVLTSG